MILLIDDQEKFAPRSLWNDRPARLPEFILGEAMPLVIGRVKRIQYPFDSRIFEPQTLTGYTIQASLGGGFILPVAGNWPITYGANSSEFIIPAQPTQEDISSVLNGLASIVAAGGVSVQGSGTTFQITFNDVGARTIISGDPSELSPLSILDFDVVVDGDATTREVQLLRIVQNAGAVATLATDSAAGSVAVTEVQAGGAGVNAQHRVVISEEVYGGKWRFKIGANTSALIGWDDSAAQVKAAIEAITGVTAGAVDVTQESERTWFVEFTTGLALGGVVTVVASNLRALALRSGELDLRTPGTEMLLNGSDHKVVSLEVTLTPSAGTPKKWQHDVMLLKPVTDASTTQPSPSLSQTEMEAYSGSFAVLTVSTTGTTDLAPGNRFIQWYQRVVVQAGAGAYTRKFTLDTAKAVDGAVFHVALEIAASANPTLSFYNESDAGTLLQTIAGDANNAQYLTAVFVFESTQWRFDGFIR